MSAISIQEFLADKEWDAPFFKLLAHNDTGAAAGHQGGMVLPKDLRAYLPSLDETVTSEIAPTTDRRLRGEMFVGTTYLTERVVRYQLQTWGGTRPAESRITDGFGPIRERARGGDLLLFQRRADAIDRFRIILVKQGTQEFAELEQFMRGPRWGPLFDQDIPVTQRQLSQAGSQIIELANQPFELVRQEVRRLETRQNRIARDSAFRELVRRQYERRCAVSGISVVTPAMLHEVECAHVVPLSEGGSDDIRNGIALTQTVHWAFDRGLFGVLPSRKIYVPRRVQQMAENAFLKQLANRSIDEAKTEALRVHPDAFHWHFENHVRQWD